MHSLRPWLNYDNPQRMATAETTLHTLQQGRRPVEDYTVNFCKWSAYTGWNEAALKYPAGLVQSSQG